ncbi:MAG: TolC family protein [Acidobacteriaceae bacterium]|nr:TolC family protein [Acidobacteriaceae bacterium]
MKRHVAGLAVLAMQVIIAGPPVASAQVANQQGASPSFGSINTPRPINPATDSTNPSARATQSLNPYLGSASDGKVVNGVLTLSLADAIARGEKYNLGLIDDQQTDARTRAQREHALAALLPQISARAEQDFEQLSFQQIGIKLPKSAGIVLPPTSGAFGYSEARIQAESPVVNFRLLDKYKQQKKLEQASLLSTTDARDVVAFAVGAAYFQVVASQARLVAAQTAETAAAELNRQVEDQFKSEVSPEIDALKARVELSTAKQRVVNATNDLEKDKLTLDRVAGIPLEQQWKPSGLYDATVSTTPEPASSTTTQSRSDLASLKQEVSAAEFGVRSAHAERLPEISFAGTYGGGGQNPANYNQVYSVQGSISVSIFTSGRIRSDVHEAEANLIQRRAEYLDLQGRVDYDIRTARLDVHASTSAVKVALDNRKLANKALEQSEDRFKNGVTNYLEVLQAQQAQEAANDNYVASMFSLNVAKMALARALGSAESHLGELFGSN